MAKKNKKTKFDPLGGYISIDDPVQPIIKNNQFGTPTAITQPTNIPSTNSFSHLIIKKVARGFTETTDAGDYTVYTLNSRNTLMITTIILSLSYVTGSVLDSSELLMYAHKPNGNIDLLAYAPFRVTVAGDSNTVVINPCVPIALDSETYDYIFIRNPDSVFYARGLILGYEIENTS